MFKLNNIYHNYQLLRQLLNFHFRAISFPNFIFNSIFSLFSKFFDFQQLFQRIRGSLISMRNVLEIRNIDGTFDGVIPRLTSK